MQKNYKESNQYLFVLYGINNAAKEFHHYLSEQKETVCAFFDNKAHEIKEMNSIPVYKLGNEPFTMAERENMIVILCLRDASQHEEVAKQLYLYDYKRVLFFPVMENNQEITNTKLRDLYIRFSHGETIIWDEIPESNYLKCRKFNIESAVIKKIDQYTVFKCPFPLLFLGVHESDFKEVKNRASENADLLYRYLNKNLVCLDYYFQLFEYLMDGEGNCDNYIKLQCGNRNQADFIENRNQLLLQYKRALSRGDDFFDNSPIEAVWNERGYFNIVDGHHRAVFLYLCGIYYMPIVVKDHDFNLFCREQQLAEINENSILEHIKSLHCPILHPAFFRNGVEEESRLFYYYQIIIQYCFNHNIEFNSLADISDYDLFFAREFNRLGCDNVWAVYWNTIELMVKINELSNIKNIRALEPFEMQNQFEGVILLNGIHNFSDKLQGIQWINTICGQTLFYETDNIYDLDFLKVNCKYQTVEKIGQAFYKNKVHEILVLNK